MEGGQSMEARNRRLGNITKKWHLNKDLKELRKKQRNLWREGTLVRGKSKCKGLVVGKLKWGREAVRLEGGSSVVSSEREGPEHWGSCGSLKKWGFYSMWQGKSWEHVEHRRVMIGQQQNPSGCCVETDQRAAKKKRRDELRGYCN